MLSTIWNSWLLVALVPPMLYAIVALIDACMIDRQIYVGPREATIVSALFGALPLLAPVVSEIRFVMPSPEVGLVAFASGVVFAVHIYYYVAGLFVRNDTVLAETVQNLSVLLVPILAWLLIGDVVSPIHYLAIAIAGVGVIGVYRFNRSAESQGPSGAGLFFISMLCFCLILIASEWVYERIDFWSGYAFFTLGLLCSGVVLFLSGEKRALTRVIFRHWRLFLLVEGITTVGMLCSHRAVDISHSVVYVAITECMGAYFILLLSGLVYWANRLSGFTLGVLVRVCAAQLVGYPGKLIAGLMISSGIYIVNSY